MQNIDFEALYSQYYSGLFGYFMKNFNRDVSLAEDLAQDTFAKIYYHSLRHIDFKCSKQYLYKTAENVKYDYIRRRKGLITINLDDISIPLLPDYSSMDISNCTSKLQPSERALFDLLTEGYNSFELAKIFNVTPSAIRARVAKLKKIIRNNGIDYQG